MIVSPNVAKSLICTSASMECEKEENVPAWTSGPRFGGKLMKFLKFKLPWSQFKPDQVCTTSIREGSPERLLPSDQSIEPKSPKIIRKRSAALKRSEEGSVELSGLSKTCGIDIEELSQGRGLYASKVNQWNDDDIETKCEQSFKLQHKHNSLLRDIGRDQREYERKSQMSYWDSVLDAGRTKKIRKRKEFMSNVGKKNPFQVISSKKQKK